MTKFITVQDDVQKEKKETVLTHILESSGWRIHNQNVENFCKIVYLGNCRFDGDMFACYSSNVIEIFKGIKGDEFND